MARVDLKLDSAGIDAVLNSGAVAGMVSSAAQRIAAATRAQVDPGAEVVVDTYQAYPTARFSSRPASSVTIRDARGRMWQVRDGVLTRAAASIGAEVKAR